MYAANWKKTLTTSRFQVYNHDDSEMAERLIILVDADYYYRMNIESPLFDCVLDLLT